MPDYKRKKVHKASREKKSDVKKRQSDDIIMKPAATKKQSDELPEASMRVVKGRKLHNRHRLQVMLITAAVIIVVCTVLSLALPVGILENVTNTAALIGGGGYPIDLSGAATLNTEVKGSYYYVLTDTNLMAVSNGGKKIYDVSHGFYSPVLTTSATRALVFDQGGNTAYIYNLGGLVETVQTDKAIITAAISRSGNYVIVTESDNYTAVVTVYSKNGEKLYEWNSAKNIINNVTIAPSGKKIAVSLLNASGGQYTSKVYVLTYDSADPAHTVDLQENIVFSLTDSGKGFNIITSNSYRFVNWSKYTTTEVTDSGEIDSFRKTTTGMVIVFNRANDKSDNTVIAVSNSGKETARFHITGIISDIKFTRGHIYCISDTTVSLFDKKGNLLRTANCGYGVVRFSVISEYSLAVITDTEIQKIDIESKE